MASSQDIRDWAVANNIELKRYGPPPKRVAEAFAAAHGELDTVTGENAPADSDQLTLDTDPTTQTPVPVPSGPPPGPTLTTGEKPPTTRRTRLRDRLWRRDQHKERSPQRGRASTEKLIGGVWSQLGRLIERTGAVPTARVLKIQAPVAGAVLDAELRGTAADHLMQPLARMVNRSTSLGSLIALPALVHVVSLNPHLYPQLEEWMEDAVYSYLEIAGPAMEKKRKQVEKRQDQTGINAKEFLRTIFAGYFVFEDAPVVDDAAAA